MTAETQDINIRSIFVKKKIGTISNPSMVEIRETLKSLKNNKGAGIDGIPYEFFKFGGEWAVRALFELYKQVWVEEVVPAKWN